MRTDPLKRSLRNKTNVIHLNNLPWNVNEEQIKEWLFEAGKRYVAKNKHLNHKQENKDENEEDDDLKKEVENNPNPFYSTDTKAGKICTKPINVFIKYRDGFTTGRAVKYYVYILCVHL